MYVKQRIYRLIVRQSPSTLKTSFTGVEMMLEESEIEAEIPEKDLEIIWRQTRAELREKPRRRCQGGVGAANKKLRLPSLQDLRTNTETSDISVIMGGNLEPLLTAYLMSKQSSAGSSPGEEAGIKSATLEIDGRYAYGYISGEKGTHRLVRQLPFNSKGLRQTSFAGVEVMHVRTKLNSTQPGQATLCRSGGKGGQNVNMVETAVRVTHIPTGIALRCSEKRSQLQNKIKAIVLLKSKLLVILEDQRAAEIKEIRGDVVKAEWGQQIRNYVFHPYKLVMDLRTNVETSDISGIMDGKLEPLLTAYLMSKQSSSSPVPVQELTADIATAISESFFSCTRTVKKGCLGYCFALLDWVETLRFRTFLHPWNRNKAHCWSGVATFCKVECGNNVALPVAAEEGFTGPLTSARAGEGDKEFWLGSYDPVLTVEGFTRQELLDLDNEGRCIVTDHGHFVLFNIYGPNVGCGDAERQDFKLKVLQHVHFNMSRQWLTSLLVSEGGAFSDAFRVFHPERAEAYWSQACLTTAVALIMFLLPVPALDIVGLLMDRMTIVPVTDLQSVEQICVTFFSSFKRSELKHLPSIPPHEAPLDLCLSFAVVSKVSFLLVPLLLISAPGFVLSPPPLESTSVGNRLCFILSSSSRLGEYRQGRRRQSYLR
ncbi:hypothetical protein SELMODRAFT_430253 [Selaginella moellendorffii]|uniref:Prokaryotic-type class I peptide chain release factors domain-containing protein n=1 Tax=Selaginella moellendorffii TaxID=88036 RepID=D8T8U3_SELML|nr:hypothetical protein SELMODRAFT_430253 [Selaginella moellendorffii]